MTRHFFPFLTTKERRHTALCSCGDILVHKNPNQSCALFPGLRETARPFILSLKSSTIGLCDKISGLAIRVRLHIKDYLHYVALEDFTGREAWISTNNRMSPSADRKWSRQQRRFVLLQDHHLCLLQHDYSTTVNTPATTSKTSKITPTMIAATVLLVILIQLLVHLLYSHQLYFPTTTIITTMTMILHHLPLLQQILLLQLIQLSLLRLLLLLQFIPTTLTPTVTLSMHPSSNKATIYPLITSYTSHTTPSTSKTPIPPHSY